MANVHFYQHVLLKTYIDTKDNGNLGKQSVNRSHITLYDLRILLQGQCNLLYQGLIRTQL